MFISSLHCTLLQELKTRLLKAENHEKIFILKAIGNFGHRTLYKPLLDIIQDNKNTLEERVTAVYALRRIAPKVPQKVLYFASHARFLKPTYSSHIQHLSRHLLCILLWLCHAIIIIKARRIAPEVAQKVVSLIVKQDS